MTNQCLCYRHQNCYCCALVRHSSFCDRASVHASDLPFVSDVLVCCRPMSHLNVLAMHACAIWNPFDVRALSVYRVWRVAPANLSFATQPESTNCFDSNSTIHLCANFAPNRDDVNLMPHCLATLAMNLAPTDQTNCSYFCWDSSTTMDCENSRSFYRLVVLVPKTLLRQAMEFYSVCVDHRQLNFDHFHAQRDHEPILCCCCESECRPLAMESLLSCLALTLRLSRGYHKYPVPLNNRLWTISMPARAIELSFLPIRYFALPTNRKSKAKLNY